MIDGRVIVVHFLFVRIVALRMYRLDIWHYGLIHFLHTKAHHLTVKSWLVKKQPMMTHLTGRTNAGRYLKTAVIPFHPQNLSWHSSSLLVSPSCLAEVKEMA